MLAISLCATAAAYRSVAVNLTDGSKVEINLTDELSATFDDENLVVSGAGEDVTVPRANIQSFSFSTKEVSGIGSVGADSDAPVISGGVMTFDNLPAGTVVSVYNMAGMLLRSEQVGGAYTLDLNSLTASPVIVTVNDVVYKIATKK